MESMENHNIQELFLNDDVQKLLDNFAGMLDLRVTFFSRFGLPIRRGKEMPNTGFCNFIQQELGLLDKCMDVDRIMREKVIEHFFFKIYSLFTKSNRKVFLILVNKL